MLLYSILLLLFLYSTTGYTSFTIHGIFSTDTAEYKAIIRSTVELRTAVMNNTTTLSGHLLSKELITSENEMALGQSEPERAAKLVRLIQQRVKMNPGNFYTFLSILEKDRQTYGCVITSMKKEHGLLEQGN